jgi:hypothetical protein
MNIDDSLIEIHADQDEDYMPRDKSVHFDDLSTKNQKYKSDPFFNKDSSEEDAATPQNDTRVERFSNSHFNQTFHHLNT